MSNLSTTTSNTRTARRTRGLVATAVVGISLLAASPVSASDYNVWRSTFGTTTPAATTGASNGTGSVDVADYVVWR